MIDISFKGIRTMRFFQLCFALSATILLAGCKQPTSNADGGAKKRQSGPSVVRLAYFPNVTHAQAVLGVANGAFQKALPEGVKLEPVTFNAGPSVIEAIWSGNIDIAYIGPSPAINGFIKSNGEEVRIIAGAAENGVLIVGNKKRGIKSVNELKGKKIATPQLGNTQDISCKAFLVNELKSTLKAKGGDTEVIPINNPEILILFQKDQIDAAWVPEPWGSRIIAEGLGDLIAEEKDLWAQKRFALTNIIARRKFLEENPDLVKRILQVHMELTKELQGDAQKFVNPINAQLKKLTGKDISSTITASALKYTSFTVDPNRDSIQQYFDKGKALGLLRADSFEIDKLVDSRILKEMGENPSSVDSATSSSAETTTAPAAAP